MNARAPSCPRLYLLKHLELFRTLSNAFERFRALSSAFERGASLQERPKIHMHLRDHP